MQVITRRTWWMRLMGLLVPAVAARAIAAPVKQAGLFQNEAGLNIVIPRELTHEAPAVMAAINSIRGRFEIYSCCGMSIFNTLDATYRPTGELSMVLCNPNDKILRETGCSSHFLWVNVRRSWDGGIEFVVSEHQTK